MIKILDSKKEDHRKNSRKKNKRRRGTNNVSPTDSVINSKEYQNDTTFSQGHKRKPRMEIRKQIHEQYLSGNNLMSHRFKIRTFICTDLDG